MASSPRDPPSTRRRLVVVAAVGVTALSVAVTVSVARFVIALFGTLEDADAAELLTALSAAGCAVVTARLALSLAAVALASCLRPGTTAHRRGRTLALALSPRWARRAVTLLLASGVAAGAACSGLPLRQEAVAAMDVSRAPPAIGLGSWGVGSLPSTTPGSTASLISVERTGAKPAAFVVGSPEAKWSGSPVLPDPLWTPLPEPGWVPSAPPPAPVLPTADAGLVASGAPQAGRSLPRAARTAEDRVVVRRGDSLWSITARHLGPGASDAEVAAAWPRWWRTNRAVIGSDPDLLLPGTRLSPPPPDLDSKSNRAD